MVLQGLIRQTEITESLRAEDPRSESRRLFLPARNVSSSEAGISGARETAVEKGDQRHAHYWYFKAQSRSRSLSSGARARRLWQRRRRSVSRATAHTNPRSLSPGRVCKTPVFVAKQWAGDMCGLHHKSGGL